MRSVSCICKTLCSNGEISHYYKKMQCPGLHMCLYVWKWRTIMVSLAQKLAGSAADSSSGICSCSCGLKCLNVRSSNQEEEFRFVLIF